MVDFIFIKKNTFCLPLRSNVSRVFASERVLIENGAIAAGNEAWVAVDAGDEAMTFSRNRVPGEGPKFVGERVGFNLVWALESNDLCSLKVGKY
jgi:hypothetical protein